MAALRLATLCSAHDLVEDGMEQLLFRAGKGCVKGFLEANISREAQLLSSCTAPMIGASFSLDNDNKKFNYNMARSNLTI